MLSLVIQALKRSVMFLCTPFANRCLIHSDWAFEITWHSSSARWDSPCADSPDHRSVRNEEVTFIWIYSLGPRFGVRCPIRESSYYKGFFLKKIWEICRTLKTVRLYSFSRVFDFAFFAIVIKSWNLIPIVGFHMMSLKSNYKTIAPTESYFHDVLEKLKTNFHTNFRFKRVFVFDRMTDKRAVM